MNSLVSPPYYSFYPSTEDDGFLHHMVRRHIMRRKSRKKLLRRALSISPKRRLQALGFGRRKPGKRNIRPISRRKPIARYVPPFRMILPRQKPHRRSPIRSKPAAIRRYATRIQKPKKPLPKPTADMSTGSSVKKKKPKMVTLNFPAPARNSEPMGGNPPIQNSPPFKASVQHQEKTTESPTPEKDKNDQEGKTISLPVKIGIALAVVVAGIWIYKSTKKN